MTDALPSTPPRRLPRTWITPLTLVALLGAASACHSDAPGAGQRKAAGQDERSPPAETARAPGGNYTVKLEGSALHIDMVWIPEGEFWIGKTELTWDDYLPYCDWEETGRDPRGIDAVSRPSKPLETFPPDRDWGWGKRPAVGMSWNAAKNYCQWLSLCTGESYRLPSEVEWRLACGDPPEGPLGDHAWYDDNSDDMTHEVGQKEPNAHGLHDMLGNLWEYTLGPFDAEDPECAALRGGAWADFAEDSHPDTRLKFDEFWNLDDPNVPPGVWWVPEGDHVGFRILRSGERDEAAVKAGSGDDGQDER